MRIRVLPLKILAVKEITEPLELEALRQAAVSLEQRAIALLGLPRPPTAQRLAREEVQADKERAQSARELAGALATAAAEKKSARATANALQRIDAIEAKAAENKTAWQAKRREQKRREQIEALA